LKVEIMDPSSYLHEALVSTGRAINLSVSKLH